MITFEPVEGQSNEIARLPSGRWLSVLTRMTGFGCWDTETALVADIDGERRIFIATSYDIRRHLKPEWTEDDAEAAVYAASNWFGGGEPVPKPVQA